MIDIFKLSKEYHVRKMDDSDVDSILKICFGNTLFYKYCEANPTKEQIHNDLYITPPNTPLSDKYYVGFYDNNTLVAVMDLINGYPNTENAFIGFFMMNVEYQGKQLGTAIINEVAEYLKSIDKVSIRLLIHKNNPQSNHFWKKNGFIVIKEVDRNGRTILLAEKTL